ncbi:hypothetical protein DAPPUDRAFT_323784 [Daphnia pulex]|uniref:Uncharacterized protein n=1 Tax=Daphnia pulex TaxID=6669 RepID=E9GZS1_DAPPU|nr:hypothetical protein DAPPUDRAFT_323784 [Daphnia pulex]|eukprot:EFX75057.1 hypothetical protein DAPPUDRAFT_323784 [Daphnia pulex]
MGKIKILSIAVGLQCGAYRSLSEKDCMEWESSEPHPIIDSSIQTDAPEVSSWAESAVFSQTVFFRTHEWRWGFAHSAWDMSSVSFTKSIWTLDLPNVQVSTKIHNPGETNFQSHKDEGKGE